MRYLAAVENAVRDGILTVPRRDRRNTLTMYRSAFRLASRGMVDFTKKMDEEGAL